MKIRVAVIYGGRTGEHEVSVRSAKAILAGLDPAKYEKIEYFIDKEGKWSPGPILPEPGAHPGIDVVFPVLHGTFGEDGTMQGLLELAGLPYVGAGVMASAVSMDKEMMKRVCKERMLPIVEYVTVTRDCPNVLDACRSLPFPGVRQARQSRVFRGHFQGARRPGTGDRLHAGRAVRSQGDCGAGHRGPRTGVRRVGQPGAHGFPALRDSALARVLRLRRQIPARSGADPGARRPARRAHRGVAASRRGMLSRGGVRGHGARGFLPGEGRPTACTSTRSIPSRASPPSACTPRCGSTAGLASANCWTG